jgi:hypothetical protein
MKSTPMKYIQYSTKFSEKKVFRPDQHGAVHRPDERKPATDGGVDHHLDGRHDADERRRASRPAS